MFKIVLGRAIPVELASSAGSKPRLPWINDIIVRRLDFLVRGQAKCFEGEIVLEIVSKNIASEQYVLVINLIFDNDTHNNVDRHRMKSTRDI
jgi:hypothetical protein